AYPVKFTKWALRPDSAGAGARRGGLGAHYEIELLEETAEAFLFGERGRFPPQGVAGGKTAAINTFRFEQSDGWHSPPLVSKMRGIRMVRGQKVSLETPGGGGYGPASDRSPDDVARDVAQGYTSPDRADADYGPAWREVMK
ncbi:MAG: hydantoinase B/oxoprolinase family protein, partial [Pseudomonadota bacterium]